MKKKAGEMLRDLQVLRSVVVSEATEIHDYVELAFANGYRLSIYNDFIIRPEGRALCDTVSQIIERVAETNDEVKLHFNDELELCVCMRDTCYHGPEAMQLNCPDGSVVVWA